MRKQPTDDRGWPSALRLTYVGHATVLVELDGVRILTDPICVGASGHFGGAGPTPVRGELDPIDAVLISHAHPDHFDRASLAPSPASRS